MGDTLHCAMCLIEKPIACFYYSEKKKKYSFWCRDCEAQYARERRQRKNKIGGHCSGCYKPLPEGHPRKICDNCASKPVDLVKARQRTAKSKALHADRIMATTEQKRHANKRAVMLAYGGLMCSCPGCLVTEIEFLTIDHIEGGGRNHRKKVGNVYRWLIKHGFPPGYRTMCMNCNLSRGLYGYCPNERLLHVPASETIKST
jgi:hypothetical protein